jgi:alanine-synthesizing transaminase
MEDEGHHIIKLNIGNLAVFGFDSPEEIQLDMIRNLPNAAVTPIPRAFSRRARR